MVNEDPFTPMTSVNIAATDLRTVLNENEDEKFSPNVKIRKVWIPKQYLVYKDELVIKGKVSTAREKEKNGRYPYIQGKECSSKRNILFQRGKGKNTSRRKILLRFVVPPPVPLEQKWHVVQHKKFPQKLTRTQKRKM